MIFLVSFFILFPCDLLLRYIMLPLHKKIERERESNDVIKSVATEQFIFFLKLHSY